MHWQHHNLQLTRCVRKVAPNGKWCQCNSKLIVHTLRTTSAEFKIKRGCAVTFRSLASSSLQPDLKLEFKEYLLTNTTSSSPPTFSDAEELGPLNGILSTGWTSKCLCCDSECMSLMSSSGISLIDRKLCGRIDSWLFEVMVSGVEEQDGRGWKLLCERLVPVYKFCLVYTVGVTEYELLQIVWESSTSMTMLAVTTGEGLGVVTKYSTENNKIQ